MKKLLTTLAILFGLLTPVFAFAQLNTHQGGTGLIDISSGSLPFGSTAYNIRLATSSALQFSNSLSRLTVTNASTTALTAASAYLSGIATGNCLQTSTNGLITGTGSACGSGGGSFPFSADTNFNQQVYSTSTPTLWFKSGMFASTTSWFDNVQTLNSTSSVSLFSASTTLAGNTVLFNATTTSLYSASSTLDKYFANNGTTTNFFSASTTITKFVALNATTTSFFSASTTLASPFVFANATGTNATTTNLNVSGQLKNGSGTGCVLSTSGVFSVTGSGCNTGTVTSITAGTGLSGGNITTSGTVALLSYLATSSAETSTQVPFWTSTNGTPAALSGGVAGFTFASAAARLTVTNASTTALTAANELNHPHGGTVPTLFAGDEYVNTNSTASTSIAFGGAATANLFAVHSLGMTLASSSLAYVGAFGAAGSTTLAIANPLHSSTLRSIACKTDAGTAWVAFGNGSATTTAVQCSTAFAQATIAANNTWTGRQTVYLEVGHSASSPNMITITADVEDSN